MHIWGQVDQGDIVPCCFRGISCTLLVIGWLSLLERPAPTKCWPTLSMAKPPISYPPSASLSLGQKCGQFWSQKPCFLQLSCVIKVLRDRHRSPIFFYVSRCPPHLSLRRHLLLSYLQTYREKSHSVSSTSAAGSHVWMLTLKLNIVVSQFM